MFALLLLLLLLALPSCGNREPPLMFTSARIAEDNGDTLTIAWHVENRDDFPITFEENRLAVWCIDLQEKHAVSTETCTLAPGEEMVVEFEVSGLDRTITQSLSVTAECREGTSGTHQFRIPPLET